jgi:hypothetical protein
MLGLVRSVYVRLRQVTCGYFSLGQDSFTYFRLVLVISGYVRLRQVSSGYFSLC